MPETTKYLLGNKIISDGADGWRPHPDWWDIRKIVDTNNIPWLTVQPSNIRYGFVCTDSENTVRLVSGYQYYLSDGTYYNGNLTVNHAWNRAYDKPCSDGYKTRAVVVCGDSRNVAISQRAFSLDGINSIWIHLGDCHVTSVLCGSSTEASANKILTAMTVNEKATANAANAFVSAFVRCFALKEVIFPQGITNPGNYAFQYCFSLTRVRFPQTVTNMGANVFYQCYSLVDIEIPQSVATIGSTTFYWCYALVTVTIPQSITSAVTGAFPQCYALTNVTIPKNFNFNLSFSDSINLSISSLENMIHNYADRTGQPALTLTIGTVNIAKLSTAIIAEATAKNITLA